MGGKMGSTQAKILAKGLLASTLLSHIRKL